MGYLLPDCVLVNSLSKLTTSSAQCNGFCIDAFISKIISHDRDVLPRISSDYVFEKIQKILAAVLWLLL